jgi:hypothetical protein
MTALPSRAQVDAAQPLEFPQRARQELGIMIKCRVNGFDCELNMSGDVDQLKRLTTRLAELGAEPVGSLTPQVTVQAQPARKAKAEAPVYDGDGVECCPEHNRKLRGPNQWGKLYCTARVGDGYCKYTYKPE